MVRIPGEESSILAVIEVVKVLLIALIVSVLTILDTVWCMYMLRRDGQVFMYQNDIGHFASKAFRTIWQSYLSFNGKVQATERANPASLKVHKKLKNPTSENIQCFSLYRLVRTCLLVSGILISIAEVLVLFAVSTEGKEVADKPEFGVQLREAVEVPNRSKMEYFGIYNAQVRYEYVLRRLGSIVMFRNNSKFTVQVPRRIDVSQDEKWPFSVTLYKKDVYATVYARNFVSEEKVKFNKTSGQVLHITESGKLLRRYELPQKDRVRNACANSIGSAVLDGNNRSGILCYSDELRDMSCNDRKDLETVKFKMNCAHIWVERFGRHAFEDQILWLTAFANPRRPTEKLRPVDQLIMRILVLRGNKRDNVSPGAIILASLLAEYPSQAVWVTRDFVVDVGVVLVPNWLLISTGVVVGLVLLSGAWAILYAARRDLVDLSNWQEMYIANLLDPLDCLNRSNRREFRCVVSEGVAGQKYQLYVEPRDSVTPIPKVKRRDIGGL